MNCSKCGSPIEPGSNVCKICGSQIVNETPIPEVTNNEPIEVQGNVIPEQINNISVENVSVSPTTPVEPVPSVTENTIVLEPINPDLINNQVNAPMEPAPSVTENTVVLEPINPDLINNQVNVNPPVVDSNEVVANSVNEVEGNITNVEETNEVSGVDPVVTPEEANAVVETSEPVAPTAAPEVTVNPEQIKEEKPKKSKKSLIIIIILVIVIGVCAVILLMQKGIINIGGSNTTKPVTTTNKVSTTETTTTTQAVVKSDTLSISNYDFNVPTSFTQKYVVEKDSYLLASEARGVNIYFNLYSGTLSDEVATTFFDKIQSELGTNITNIERKNNNEASVAYQIMTFDKGTVGEAIYLFNFKNVGILVADVTDTKSYSVDNFTSIITSLVTGASENSNETNTLPELSTYKVN